MRAGVTVQASRGVNPPDRSVTELTPERAERGSELHERRREEVEVLLGGELEERLRRGPRESERLLGDDVFPVLEREARQFPVALRRREHDDDLRLRVEDGARVVDEAQPGPAGL